MKRRMIMLMISLVMVSGCGKEDESVSLPEESYGVTVEEQATEQRALYFYRTMGMWCQNRCCCRCKKTVPS